MFVCVCVGAPKLMKDTHNICVSCDAVLGQLSMEGAEREFAEVPEFKRKKGERQADFMHRVDTTTTMAIKESQIEASFKVNAAEQIHHHHWSSSLPPPQHPHPLFLNIFL